MASTLAWLARAAAGLGQSTGARLAISAALMLLGGLFIYRRIQRSIRHQERRRERERRAERPEAKGNVLARFVGAAGARASAEKVCVVLNQVVLRALGEPDMSLVEEAVPALRALARGCQLFLLAQLPPGAPTGKEGRGGSPQELQVESAVRALGLEAEGFRSHRLLFCSTDAGRVAQVRHIEPALLVEASRQAVEALRPHIPSVLLIAASPEPLPAAKNVYYAKALAL